MRAASLVGLALIGTCLLAAAPQPGSASITLERSECFGSCAAYLLHIDSSGAVSFRQGPPSNRHQEHTSTISTDAFDDLAARLAAVHFFQLKDLYEPTHTDGRTTFIRLVTNGQAKRITHSDYAPPGLQDVERTIERVTNIHRWLHGDPGRLTLQSPISGALMRGGEDLKNESWVRDDAYSGIKPGMTPLMQAAGIGDLPELRRLLKQGGDVNAVDETGWTALMIAAVTPQPAAVSALLDAGARVDQRDKHGDTALIGAASVRFASLRKAADVVDGLLTHGAVVEATNEMGETALMWAARAGNYESIKLLLQAGADPARTDRSGHNALFYLKAARQNLSFDPDLVRRYDQAIQILERR